MKWTIITLCLQFVAAGLMAQSNLIGKWKTIDDNTGKTRSIVEITERQGKIYGRVIKIFSQPGEDPDPLCSKCDLEDSRYNRKVIGMEIISNMIKDQDEYTGGTILDPEVGKVYRCKLWIEGEELKLRGYLGPFFRTQTWTRFTP